MLVLAIDASLGPVSAAVHDTASGHSVAHRDDAADGRAERLPKLVADLLTEARATPAEIDRIAVTVGPGGFTGVRVGIAFARGFALVHGTPVVGVDTLTALALSAEAPQAGVTAFVQGRRGRLLARRFDRTGAPLGPVEDIDATALATLAPDAILAGPEADRLAPGRPAITAMSVLALARHAATLDPAASPPEPIYAAPPDAIAPAPSRLLAVPVPARADMPIRPAPATSTIGEQ